MSKLSLPGAIAVLFRDTLPKELEEFHRGEGDAAQTSMWLVGLASSTLLFCAANPNKVDQVFFGLTRLGVACLMITVMAGVLNRVLRVWVGRRISRSIRHLHGHFAGHSAAEQVQEPDELSDQWDRDEIVARLRSEFDVDYTFLQRSAAALPDCQQCYRNQYAIWERFNLGQLAKLKMVFAAHMGLSDGQVDKMFEPPSEADLGKVKRSAWVSGALWRISTALFVVAVGAFLVAAVIVSRGLWVQAAVHSV